MYDELLDQWALPRARRLVRAAKGYSNETWSVACDSGEYFLRLYTDPRLGPIRFEHAVLGELAGATLPFDVPEVVPTIAGDTVALANAGDSARGAADRGRQEANSPTSPAANPAARPAALFRRLPGTMLDDDDHEGVWQAAFAFGTLDRALSRIGPLAHPAPSFDGDLTTVDPAVRDLATTRGEVGEDAFAFLERAAASAREVYASGLPRQLVHDDFAFTNVLLEHGRVRAILDFEYIGMNLRAKDLAGALAVVLNKSNSDARWRPLLDGYLAALPLGDDEISALPRLTLIHHAITLVWCVGRVRAGVLPAAEIPKHVTRALALDRWMAASSDHLVTEARRSRG